MKQTEKHTAECPFDCTPITRVIMLAMAFVPLFVLMILFTMEVDIGSVGGLLAYAACVLVMAAGLVFKMLLGKGRISVDDECVNISYGFLGRKIPLSEITYFSCDVEAQNGIYGDITYTLVLTIRTADKRYHYERELDVEKDYPAKHPEEYRKFLDEQPMMKLCGFVKEIKGF